MTDITTESPYVARQEDRKKQGALQKLLRLGNARIGLSIILIIVLLALFAPYLTEFDPIKQNLRQRFQPPSATHWFGTDEFGRDLFTRVAYGARISLQVGLIVVLISVAGGTFLGLLAGYFRGWVDTILQQVMETWIAFPSLLLALAIFSAFEQSLGMLMIIVGIGGIPGDFRVVRGVTLSLQQSEFVEASKAMGARSPRLIWKHVLPGVLPPLIVSATLSFPSAILATAALSFIGFGAQPPTPEWGAIIASGRAYLRTEWWIATLPGITLALTVLGLNLLGDGLRDLLDPRMRK
jgi:peptide/nickel transport system permease protein